MCFLRKNIVSWLQKQHTYVQVENLKSTQRLLSVILLPEITSTNLVIGFGENTMTLTMYINCKLYCNLRTWKVYILGVEEIWYIYLYIFLIELRLYCFVTYSSPPPPFLLQIFSSIIFNGWVILFKHISFLYIFCV